MVKLLKGLCEKFELVRKYWDEGLTKEEEKCLKCDGHNTKCERYFPNPKYKE